MTKQVKMIYPDQAVARQIAVKLTESSGKTHIVVPVTTGYQVCPVQVVQSAMPPAKAAPVGSLAEKLIAEGASAFITLKFRGESKVYVDAFLDDGKPVSFGKSTLISWERDEVAGLVKLRMSIATAKKRGLLAA